MKFINKQLQHRAMRVQAADYQTPQGHLSLTGLVAFFFACSPFANRERSYLNFLYFCDMVIPVNIRPMYSIAASDNH